MEGDRRRCAAASNRLVYVGDSESNCCPIRTRLQLAERTRELALFNLAVDSKLRSFEPLLHGCSNGIEGGSARDSGRRVGVTPLTRRCRARVDTVEDGILWTPKDLVDSALVFDRIT